MISELTNSDTRSSPNYKAYGHIVLATYRGRNATVLREVLEAESMVCVHAASVEAVAEAIETNAALVVVTEEVFTNQAAAEQIGRCLNDQPSWSDIPVIILMRDYQRFADCLGLMNQTAHQRSVLLLELPLKRQIFAAMVRACLQNRQRQYALRDTLYQLQESNRTLESFSYTAAHELRNPLGIMTSSFDLLARMALDAKQQKIVGMGQRTAKSMNQVLGALLDYGKMRSQGTESFLPVDMNKVLEESVSNFQQLIKDRQAKVSWSKLPVVLGARQLLVQLVSNLVKNAIVHNEAALPTITIAAEPRPATSLQAARWLFLVSDNGPGVAPDDQEKIFAMFNRAGKSRAEGSGIGLALCRRVVEQHQGEIGVRSVVGEGSTFYFDLAQVGESDVG
ncbi:MAG: hypothetical protein DCF25_00900 [Leptolyngbya foveolarum]|uniref:histidine kinase n=1 Tax=Leptolyngbya foveolarum TaxID=47253 RepID=A0A2W4UST4_9CYAN|nr:MAG: hypothetical protein DCF25_00900 [Leptolyngbya foveolarum]